jgi:hypothetical protein
MAYGERRTRREKEYPLHHRYVAVEEGLWMIGE